MSSNKRKTKGTPDSVDIHVGKQIRTQRSLLGMSQQKLAESIGLTFQQVQKYERGTNRVSAGRLYQFSKLLNVPISYFFDQYGEAKSSYGFSDNEQAAFGEEDLMQKKETLELVRVYYSVQDEQKRKSILKFIKSMAEDES